MTLHAIVAALGGDLFQGGRRASVPAPGHSPADRSVSLLLADGRVVVHGFGAADWRAVLEDLRARGLIDAVGRPCGTTQAPAVAWTSPTPTRLQRLSAARTLWCGGVPIPPGSLAERHLRHRAVRLPTACLSDLRMHPAAPVAVYRLGGQTRPALVAAVRDGAGALTGVELTYLNPNGRVATGLRLARKAVGLLPPGSAVRLASSAPEMVVGEGVFTTLSAMEQFHLPGWALLAAHNQARWVPPAEVRSILVAADRGPVGERAAARLCERLRATDVEARVRLPPPPFGDWNEMMTARAIEAEGKGAEGRRDGGDRPRADRTETAR